jgi:hypothetical protein
LKQEIWIGLELVRNATHFSSQHTFLRSIVVLNIKRCTIKKRAKFRMKESRKRQDDKMASECLAKLVKLADPTFSAMRKAFGERIDEFLPYAERIRSGEAPDKVWAVASAGE